jgi:hypothetical protein
VSETVGATAVDDASPTSSRAWNSAPTSAVILAAILGAGLGAAVLYADWWSWGTTDRTFAHSSSFILWASLICAQTTLWTLACVPVVATLRRHWNGWHSHRADIVSSSLLIVCLVAGIVAVSALQPQIPNVIPRSHWKVRGLTGVALLVALVASVSIWLIRGRLAELRAGASKKELELYVQFRRDLERLLAFLGAVVGLAVLSSAALRRVVLAYAANGHPNADLPAEYPLLYGLILSLVVALIYLPTYLDLLEAGSNLRDRAAPLSEPDDPNFEAAVSKRKTLTDLLGLEVSASTSFRASVTILTPLFAALVTLLPKFNN